MPFRPRGFRASIRPVLLWAALLAACAAPVPDLPPVPIAPHLAVALPSPAEAPPARQVVQLVTARYGARTIVFQAYLRPWDGAVRLTCLDSLGRVAMTVLWTAAGLAVHREPWVPAELKPENILADIVLIYWPEAVVRSMLAGGGAVLRTGPDSRTVSQQGQDVIRMTYHRPPAGSPWDGRVDYRNEAFGYTLDIQSRLEAP